MDSKESHTKASDWGSLDPLRAPTVWGDMALVDAHAPPAVAARGNAFDVCHVGLVLRVLVGVQAVLCLVALYGVSGFMAWVMQWSHASAQALPACLLWLVMVCGIKRWLGRLPSRGQWVLVCALGALAGSYGHGQMALLGWWLGEAELSLWSWAGPVSSGAALAGVCMAWLRLRQGRAVPEHTQARLVELQARIRPHFLFNTLNTAIALVQIDPERAEKVLEDLAELFRRALASPSTQTTLAQEIDLARRYMDIEQLRFGDRLRVSWYIDEQVLPAVVPTLLLQPLVENAVKHGVEPDPAGGWVKVQADWRAERVVVTISNSLPEHATPDDAKLDKTTRGHGMALRNVRQRLLLMHDVEAVFEAGIRSEPRCYVVQFSWPASWPAKGLQA